MYFFSSKELIKDLQTEELPRGEGAKYLLFWVITLLLFEYLDSLIYFWPEVDIDPFDPSMLSIKTLSIQYCVLICIHLIGVFLCYRNNKKGNGLNFVEKFISLSVPFFMRLLFYFFSFIVLLDILEALIKPSIYSYIFESAAFEFFFYIIINFMFYYFMVAAFEDINIEAAQNETIEAEVVNE